MHVRCKGWKDTARSVAAPGACWVAALVRTKDTRTSRKGHEYVTLEVACQRSPVRCTAYSTQWCITERRSATLRPGRRGCWNDHSTYPLVLTCTVSLNVSAGGGGAEMARPFGVACTEHVQSTQQRVEGGQARVSGLSEGQTGRVGKGRRHTLMERASIAAVAGMSLFMM